MFKKAISFLFIIVISATVSAQEKCQALFDESAIKLQSSIKEIARVEYSWNLTDDTVEFIQASLTKRKKILAKDRKEFLNITEQINLFDRSQKRNAEEVLQKPITNAQATALKLALAIGRDQAGVRHELPGFKGNYTDLQMTYKDKVLDLAGFSKEERAILLTSDIVQDVLTKYTGAQFLDQIGVKSVEQAVALNNETLLQMKNLASEESLASKRKQKLSFSEADELLEAVRKNPVADLYKVKDYDPEGCIGFCFGRAMTSHLEALSKGINKESIRKAFVVGDLKAVNSDIRWGYHVATIVMGNNQSWWVLDPIFPLPLKLDDWYQQMYARDESGQLRLFISDAARFGPGSNEWYAKPNLQSDFYNSYFNDLLKYFKKRSQESKTVFDPFMMKSFFDLFFFTPKR